VAGVRGEGYDVRLEAALLTGGLIEEMDEGREGKSCDNLSEPDVFLRTSGGRLSQGAFPLSTAGEPTRRAFGTESIEGFRVVTGDPIWRGDGTWSMAGIDMCKC
jgi:hypothetical protein